MESWGNLGSELVIKKKPENVLVEKKSINKIRIFLNFRKSQKISKFSKSQKISKFSKISKFKKKSKCQNVEFFKKFRDFRDFRNFENFELFFLHDEKIFSIPIFFNDLDYVSRVPENYLEHSMTSSEEDIDRVWGAFS